MKENIQNYKKSYVHNDIECMILSIDVPKLNNCDKPNDRITRFYAHKIKQFEKLAEKYYLPEAAADTIAAMEGSYSFKQWYVRSKCSVTLETDKLFSVFRETTVMRGRHKYAEMFDYETWDLSEKYPVRLNRFVSKKEVKDALRKYSGSDKALGKYLTSHLSNDNYYLTNTGAVVFYPERKLQIPIPIKAYEKQTS